MDYNFEILGDERFQEFCSALISKEFPNVSTFPVGQPDGGRDSLVYFMESTKKEFIVFQVKFVRNPHHHKDIHKWLTSTIAEEAEKINRLIPKGATSYYLLTNVPGTAHLDVGSKDLVNSILEKQISVPALCWWREDLCTMFEKDPIFMWSFPEVLNGQDCLNLILFSHLNEHRERRESVIRAYLADQYRMDNEVKFRQIDLQNRLLDLFTDVPIRVKKFNEKNKGLKWFFNGFNEDSFYVTANHVRELQRAEPTIRAAAFLLSPRFQDNVQRALLEGGPGQGKSTVSQYICQVHRARLLNKLEDIEILPEHVRCSPIRLPFKIDLRHIAAWVENKNPYQETISDEQFSRLWQKSLESFLVGHIHYHSQLDITTADLIAILKMSSVVFVFDGFDEIAALEVRKEVIEFINKGVSRLTENSRSIHVLVTSRPSVFSDTMGFSIESYPHFELTDVTPLVTKEYVDKWIKANKLDAKEAAQIKKLVDEKLQMSHLRGLAKTPMQLAIFISLLRTKGESLPNKRTALYDSYIELFFDRESEKNSLIRDKRDLIIDIHQYLAWVLHSEAELFKHSGSIHIDDLKTRLKTYLLKEGHDTSIADKLFDVVKDRVCALASRVQGTFEFEVQPLREYFCAKYLYKTAQYSPVGDERNGTLPDRFEGIVKNFYWQNVARFFAGCFSKGELSMLIQKLKELQEDPTLRYTNYPRVITSQLLSDFVFTQYPLHLKDVIRIIIDGLNIGNIINQSDNRSAREPILLPLECGRFEVVSECFNMLKTFPPNDYAFELIGIIKNNPFNALRTWTEFAVNLLGNERTRWVEYAYHLEIIHKIPTDVLDKILETSPPNEKEKLYQILIDGNRFDLVARNIAYKRNLLEGILEQKLHVLNRQHSGQSLFALSMILYPYFLKKVYYANNGSVSAISFLENQLAGQNKESGFLFNFSKEDEVDITISNFIQNVLPMLSTPVSVWSKTLENWTHLIESLQAAFGRDYWSIKVIGVIAAGVKSQSSYDEFEELTNNELDLAKRARCARMRSGSSKYWKSLLETANDRKFVLLTLVTWCTPKTLIELNQSIELALESLSTEDYLHLKSSLNETTSINLFTKVQQRFILQSLIQHRVSDAFKYLIAERFSPESRIQFIYDNISTNEGILEDVGNIKLQYLIRRFLKNPKDSKLLSEIKGVYRGSSLVQIDYNEHYYYYGRRFSTNNQIPYEVAKSIMADCKEYPTLLVSFAENACRLYANEKVVPVGKVAKDAKWFIADY